MLCDSTFHKVDPSNVKITDCIIRGMTIDGVSFTDLLKEYERRKRQTRSEWRRAAFIR
jgi:hypothetical protein